MKTCKSHNECFTKICSLCEDYKPLSSDAVLADVRAIAEKALEGDGEFEPNYTKLYFKALLDIVNKVSEHFS